MNLLPFLPEFHEKVLDGRKTATARSKPYGKPGDKLQGPRGSILVLEAVNEAPLGVVAGECFGYEGLSSPTEFVAIWNRIHPRKTYKPGTMVFLHRFHVEGRWPVCDAGFELLPLEDRKRFYAENGKGWAPVWNDEAAHINRSKGCPAHAFRHIVFSGASEVNGIEDPATLVCVACMEDGATPGGAWTEFIPGPLDMTNPYQPRQTTLGG